MGKDYRDRVEFMGKSVSRDGLVFDANGEYRAPTLRFRKNGGLSARRLRFYKNGKQLEFSYDRFVYAAWNQDTFDINDKDLVVRRLQDTGGSHVDNLIVEPRVKMLAEASKSTKLFTDDEEEAIRKMYQEVEGELSLAQIANTLGISYDTLKRIVKDEH